MLSPERFINVCGFSNWIFLPSAFSVALSPLNFLLQLRLETKDNESAKSHAALCRFRSYCFPVLPKKATNSIKSMAKYYRDVKPLSTEYQKGSSQAYYFATYCTALCCFISCYNFLQNAPAFVRLYLFLYNPLYFWLK